jgi:hypothetical protein
MGEEMIHLARSVPVRSFDAQATVSVGRDRPEFLAVARLAADLARPIGARDISTELLGPVPDVFARRVIDRCVSLSLLARAGEDHATLSEAGRLALEHSQVLVPEEGIWRFFLVDDPLVPSVLVHVERLETERARRNGGKPDRPRGADRTPTSPPPETLRRCCDPLPRVSVRDGRLFQLREVANKGAVGPDGTLRLALDVDDRPSMRLTGTLPTDDAVRIDAGLTVPAFVTRSTPASLWQALVACSTGLTRSELERWHATAGKPVVPSDFASLSPAARHAFRRDLAVPASDLGDLGRFDPTALKDVDLVPRTDRDAQEWLEWLQWESITDYMTPQHVDRTAHDLRERFPHHAPRAASADDLLAKARAIRDERAWFLLAPADLGLWS